MAIYHFSGTIISRSQGRSAVACAAYRSGERLMDERYDKVHDFTRKEGVVYQAILLPENAPSWMSHREQLWNGVEASEKRKDAQLAREFNFALPKELTLEQNITLARAFVQEQFVSKGMVADLCIHLDKNKEGESLPHAHVMLTTREVTLEGFSQKVRAWNSKELLIAWREAWSETANWHLALNGIDQQIDHRTLVAQAIPLEPQYKIGPVVAWDRMVRLEDHQRIARENGERLFVNPEIALHTLTRQQSTFTHQDLARFVNRHTVDAAQFGAVFEKVKQHESIVCLGLDDNKRERFTTQEMLRLETNMLKDAQVLAHSSYHAVLESHQQKALGSRALSEEQQHAFHYLLESKDLCSLVGYAGSGKSTLLGAAREAWEAEGYRVQGITLAGIAAQTLEGSSGISSRTLASHRYYWDRGEKPSAKDILVVDEAGMLGSRQIAHILSVATEGRAKVVLVGDPQQLQAIEAGAPFRGIIEQTGYLELTQIWRQQASWQQIATKDFAQGRGEVALHRYQRAHHIHAFPTQIAAKEGLIQLWNDVRLTQPQETQIILAYTREEVKALNLLARDYRAQRGELGIEDSFSLERGERCFAVNDRVYFLKNDRSLGVMNGTLGTLEAFKESRWWVRLDAPSQEGRLISFDLNHYNHLEYGYAATVHKAQGVTVDRTYLLGSRYFNLHATYVGMTRHRLSADLFYSEETFPHYKDLVQTLSRDKSKDLSLDYVQNVFTSHRGLEKMRDGLERANVSFKERFEAEHPERAKALQEKLFNRMDIDKTIGSAYLGTASWLEKKQVPQDIEQFRKQFEIENPERAKAIHEALIPSHEKALMKFVAEYTRLQELVKKGGRSQYLAEHQLKQLVKKGFQDKLLMQSLKEHHLEIAKEVITLQKNIGRERDFGLER